VGLPAFFCQAYTDERDAVFDPFLGSGSTLIAAERTNRRGFGCEISPAYCDVVIVRWQALTDAVATRESDGLTLAQAREAMTDQKSPTPAAAQNKPQRQARSANKPPPGAPTS
jgi:hypothetical protein